jgi:hypothetical protein
MTIRRRNALSFDAARADVLAKLPASGHQPDCGCEV